MHEAKCVSYVRDLGVSLVRDVGDNFCHFGQQHLLSEIGHLLTLTLGTNIQKRSKMVSITVIPLMKICQKLTIRFFFN